jgi:ribosomal protein S18 acetylase RimI-like enzyme
MIKYEVLTIDMYDLLVQGWSLLPENATGLGDDKQSIAKYLDRNEGCSFAAFNNRKMIGAVLSGHDGRRAFFNHLFVIPEYRKQGVASKLVEISFEKLKKEGIKRVGIFIHKTNISAQLFWHKIGFEKVDFVETYGIDLE